MEPFLRGIRGGPLQWQDDDYHVEDDSDFEGESSEEETDLDIIMHGTSSQRRKLLRRALDGDTESSGDEFEKEMGRQLDAHVRHLESGRERRRSRKTADDKARGKRVQFAPDSSKSATSAATHSGRKPTNDFSDSESDDERSDLPQPSNDELLYDPGADDEDQRWVDRQRIKARRMAKQSASSSSAAATEELMQRGGLMRSDGVLSCPCCMVTLCRDCQRHDKYENQYRAMFVTDQCRIDYSKLLRYPKKTRKEKQGKRQRGGKTKAGAEDPFKDIEKNESISDLIDELNESAESSKDSVDKKPKSQEKDGSAPMQVETPDDAKKSNSTTSPVESSVTTTSVPLKTADSSPNCSKLQIQQPSTLPSSSTNVGGSSQEMKEETIIDNNNAQTCDSSPTKGDIDPGETFYAVRCAECNTQVAVFDNEDVYHFFNTLTSYG